MPMHVVPTRIGTFGVSLLAVLWGFGCWRAGSFVLCPLRRSSLCSSALSFGYFVCMLGCKIARLISSTGETATQLAVRMYGAMGARMRRVNFEERFQTPRRFSLLLLATAYQTQLDLETARNFDRAGRFVVQAVLEKYVERNTLQSSHFCSVFM